MPELNSMATTAAPALIQTLRSAKAESKTGGDGQENADAQFSTDLGKAIEQQLDNARAASALPSPDKERLQAAALAAMKGTEVAAESSEPLKATESGSLQSGMALASNGDVAAGEFASSETEASSVNALPVSDEQARVAENTVNTLVSASPDTELKGAASLDRHPVAGSDETNLLETGKRQMPLPGTVATAMPMNGDTVNNESASKTPKASANDGIGRAASVVQPALAQGSATQAEKSTVAQVTPAARSIETSARSTGTVMLGTLNVNTSASPSGTEPDGELPLLEPSGLQSGPGIQAGTVAATGVKAVDDSAGLTLTTASASTSATSSVSAQAHSAAQLLSTPPIGTEVKQVGAAGAAQSVVATQPVVDIARQSQLMAEAVNRDALKVASSRGQGTEAVDTRTSVLQPVELVQTMVSRLAAQRVNTRATDSVPNGELPSNVLPEGVSGSESLMSAPEVKTTVQQRLASAEAMLSQMSMDSTEASVRRSVPDSTLASMPVPSVAPATGIRTEVMTAPLTQAPFNIPLDSADAESALAGNVKWMANESVKNAVMTVTPQGMGPISVKIGIEGDQMDVSIMASQNTTREALESMLPRLREQLAVQGHESVKVEVSDGKSEQSRNGNGQTFADSRSSGGATSQNDQNNGSNHQEKPEYGRTNNMEVVSDSFMAEDLQRVAGRVTGETHDRPVFDAYV